MGERRDIGSEIDHFGTTALKLKPFIFLLNPIYYEKKSAYFRKDSIKQWCFEKRQIQLAVQVYSVAVFHRQKLSSQQPRTSSTPDPIYCIKRGAAPGRDQQSQSGDIAGSSDIRNQKNIGKLVILLLLFFQNFLCDKVTKLEWRHHSQRKDKQY